MANFNKNQKRNSGGKFVSMGREGHHNSAKWERANNVVPGRKPGRPKGSKGKK